MAKGKTKTKGKGKKNYKKNYKKGFAPSKWGAAVSLCPDRQMVKLKYTEILEYNQAGTIADTIFRQNCHIDCNVTAPAAGKYSFGSPNWYSFYNFAYVTKSKINAKVLNAAPVGTNTIQCTIFPSNVDIPTTNSQEANMRARNRSALMNSTTDTKNLNVSVSTKSIIGKERDFSWDYLCTPTVPQFPINGTFFHVVTELVSGVAGPVVILVDIEYTVVFFDRKQVLATVNMPTPPPPSS